ncbi:MAG TPA: SDR family NAD(P)-dependent oxidoreductase [Solirubrobacterales bacterium]|nr:SDR family NAD(P)-dependent oxidoreductase [Solirubrobacterales bacterium]
MNAGDAEPERVLITGASSGIGLATAIEFGTRGADVALLARSANGLERGAEKVRAAGGNPLVSEADVTDRVGLEAAIERAAATFGGLDAVVVNAGAAAFGRFTETGTEDFDRTLAVTLRGAVQTIRLVLPHLERSGGSLVVVGSVADTIPLPLMAAYTAAKHGLRGFVDALGIELRSQGSSISLALVSPGPVDTPFWDNVATQEGHLPPRIPGAYRPEEVAVAIVRCVERRRSAGVTVGGAIVVIRALHSLLNPISERVLARIARWAGSAGAPGPGGRAIHGPAGDGVLRTGLGGRPSLTLRGLSAVGDAPGMLLRR